MCSDLTWNASVFGKVVPQTNTVIQTLPAKVTNDSLVHVLSTIQLARLCPGNPEFVQLLETKGGKACDQSGSLSAFIDDKEEIVVGANSYDRTVRRVDCGLICPTTSTDRCPTCTKYRAQLFVQRSREAKKSGRRTSHDSHVPFRHLNSTEKDECLKNLSKAKHAEKSSNTRLKELLNKEIDAKGVTLTQEDAGDVTSMLSDISPLLENFPKSSIQRIFWEQQLQNNSLKDKRQMKWHPLLIRFALNLKYASTSAYRAVQDSGLISLPSERTLRDYTHWTSIKDGPQVEVLQHIKKTIGMDEMSSPEKHFVLSMDEMKIRSGLIFKKNTGELVGYCSLGESMTTWKGFLIL